MHRPLAALPTFDPLLPLYRAASYLKHNLSLPGRALLNQLYYNPSTCVIPCASFDYVVIDGCRFVASDQLDLLQPVAGNPWFDNVRRDDIVLDIGAHIGAITVPLAMTARHVYAVEPVWADVLERNIALNNLSNVTVLRSALSDGNGHGAFHFSSRSGEADTMPFCDLLQVTGPVDFLKVDCEGAEWTIRPPQLLGIREIRAELHIRRACRRRDRRALAEWLAWLESNGYRYSVEYGAQPGPCVPCCDCVLLNASLDGAA